MAGPSKKATRDTDAAERARRKRKFVDELLDESLDDTFPASDPLAILEPAPGRKPGEPVKYNPKGKGTAKPGKKSPSRG
ncbi:MAG: hypothetical protein AB7O70_07405 [Hyphomicrobiales bacterium]